MIAPSHAATCGGVITAVNDIVKVRVVLEYAAATTTAAASPASYPRPPAPTSRMVERLKAST